MTQEEYLRMLDEEMETRPRGQAKAKLNEWLSNNDPSERISKLHGTVSKRRV